MRETENASWLHAWLGQTATPAFQKLIYGYFLFAVCAKKTAL